MGVKSLWSLLTPVGRPIMLETVEGKIMAIDSSIWIYQFQATMRTKDGRALLNAHVLGFLRRISKLLFYGIKPVFVFDGGAPALKTATLAERRKKKSGAAASHIKLAEKLLAAQMRKEALNAAQAAHASGKPPKRKSGPSGPELDPKAVYLEDIDPKVAKSSPRKKPPDSEAASAKKNKYRDTDPYHLPDVNMEEAISKATRTVAPDPRLATEDELRAFIEDMRPEDFDITSAAFRELPTEVQYEIVGDLRLKSRQTSYARLQNMLRSAPTPLDFSKQQIKNLRQRNSLTQQLLMTTDSIGRANITIPVRIAGERNREYVLVKNEGPSGGWILGIRDDGTQEKPIVIDKESDHSEQEDSDDDDMEEVEVPVASTSNEVPSTSINQANQDIDPDLRIHRRQMALTAIANRYTSKKLAPLTTKLAHQVQGKTPLFDLDAEDYDVLMENEQEDGDDDDPELVLALQELYDSGQFDTEADPSGPVVSTPSPSTKNSTPKKSSAAKPLRTFPPDDDSDNEFASPSRLGTALSIANISPFRPSSSAFHESPSFRQTGHHLSPVSKLNPESRHANRDSQPSTPFTGSAGSKRIAGPSPQSDSDEDMEEVVVPIVEPLAETTLPSSQVEANRLVVESDEDDFYWDPSSALFDTKTALQATVPKSASPAAPVLALNVVPSPGSPPLSAEPSETSKATTSVMLPSSAQPNTEHAVDSSGHDRLQNLFDRSPTALQVTTLSAPSSHPESQESTPVLSLADETVESLQPAPERLDDAGPSHLRNPNYIVPAPDDPSELDEEFFMDWSRSPSPSLAFTEPQAASHSKAPRATETWDPVHEMDVHAEEGEFARFLSQVKGKGLDDAQREIDEEILTLNQQRKNAMRDSEDVTQQMISQIMVMLRLFGIPYLTAPMEAEAQCAELVNLGLVDGVITDDSDVFLFGAQRVFKNMFNQSKTVECFLLADLSRELGLDRDTLIRLAYLLGSDYVDGLPGVGPVVAMELLKEFPGENGLYAFKDWWMKVQTGKDTERESGSKFRSQFKRKFKKLHLQPDWPNPVVKDAYYHPTVDSSDEPFKWGLPDLDGLRSFFREELSWNQQKVDDLLLPIIQKMNQRGKAAALNKQSNLADFFDLSAGTGSYAPRKRQAYSSKRLQQVVTDFKKGKSGPTAPTTETDGSGEGDETEEKEPKGRSKAGKRKPVGARKAKAAATKKSSTEPRGSPNDDDGKDVAESAEVSKKGKKRARSLRGKTASSKRKKSATPSSDAEDDFVFPEDMQSETTSQVKLRPRPKPAYRKAMDALVDGAVLP